jgi:hypothetical protein
MGRPKKNPEDRIDTQLDPSMPIPVTVVANQTSNPHAGKYPSIDDPIEKRRYKFVYNQNPGTPLEFTKGRSVLKRNGLPGIVFESFCLEDDNEYELPVDVAKHLNGLVYSEQGAMRPRCTCIEVD